MKNRLIICLMVILMAGFILLGLSSANQSAFAGQGKGGEVVAKPTPTPKKTTTRRTTPARTPNNSKTNQAAKSTSNAASAAEMIFWNSIKDSANPEDYNEYLKKYPSGEFSGLARSRLSALENAKAEAARKEEEARKRPPRGASVRNQIAMDLVWIPPGTFMMGSDHGRTNELPVHRVTIKDGFYMGRYEVTPVAGPDGQGSKRVLL